MGHRRQSGIAFGLKINGAGAGYIALTLLLGFSAVNTGNNLLFLIVSGLLSFMCVTGLAGMLNLRRLIPELLPPPEIHAGVPAPFRLTLHNGKRRIPSFLIRVEHEGQGVTIPVLPPGSTANASIWHTFDRRGRAPLGRITVSSCFPVNFFKRYWSFSVEESCIIFPHPVSLRGWEGNGDLGWSGRYSRGQRGLDGEIEQVSSYTGREPLRMIHWKHSARVDDLLVKAFGRRSAQPLIIDLQQLPGSTLEERISRAAWLVRRWSSERPVGLILGNSTFPAEAGHRQAVHLLTELALYGEQ